MSLDIEKGVSLYLAFMVMTILLAIALGLSTIFIGQTRMIKEMGNSVIAFYAADAGIERVMYNIYKTRIMTSAQEDWNGDYGYEVNVNACQDNSADTCITSKGWFKGVNRAIQARIPGAAISFPQITNASVEPTSGPPGTPFTISADIADADRIDPLTTIAHIQNPDETDIATVILILISGDEFDGTYAADWSSARQPSAAYYIDIKACDLFIPSLCSELENLETLIQQ